MKKYDLILAVLYILPVILGFIIFYNLKNPSDQEMEKAGAYIEKLYKQPVSNVVIYNTDMAVRVIESPEKVKQGFKITGVIPFRQVSGGRRHFICKWPRGIFGCDMSVMGISRCKSGYIECTEGVYLKVKG